jgi:hypothetical protein
MLAVAPAILIGVKFFGLTSALLCADEAQFGAYLLGCFRERIVGPVLHQLAAALYHLAGPIRSGVLRSSNIRKAMLDHFARDLSPLAGAVPEDSAEAMNRYFAATHSIR